MEQSNYADHDLLITLATKLEQHSLHESETSRSMLTEITKMSSKMDQLKDASQETTRDIKEITSKLRDDDIRIATLRNQVDALQDTAEKAVAVSEAVSKANDRRIKTWTVASGIIAFVLANGPTILTYLAKIFT